MRQFLGAVVVGLLASVAQAHMVYLVPDPADAGKVTLVFSDDLNPDPNVKAESFDKVAAAQLFARGADGKPVPVTGKRDGHSVQVAVPAGATAVYGTAEYGVFQRGENKPMRLTYYPKAAVGPQPADGGAVGAAVEILVVKEAGQTRFRVLSDGKPAAKVEVTAKLDEANQKLTTDENGLTPAVKGTGRYAVYARVTVDKAGEVGGKKYDTEARYATLVVDVK